jgi:hypothetical protein
LKQLVTILLSCLMFACVADAGGQDDNSEDNQSELGSAQQALGLGHGGGGLGVATCPGGGSAMCVTCSDSDFKCVAACYGGYTCDTDSDSCSVELTCRTAGGGIGGHLGKVFIP